jgi:hypothetical protein
MPYITAPDPEFLDQIEKMEEASAAADEATRLAGQRRWMLPPLQGWDGDPQNIPGLNKAFTRDNLNSLYKKIISDMERAGTTGEAMVAKLQIDYIAAMERAYRTRHCSSVRAKLHAAGRRRGQSQPNGVFTGSVVLWLERLIFAAHDNPYMGVNPGEPPNG